MKELDKHNQDISKHQMEIEAQQKEQQEFKLDSSFKPKRGHKVWEINLQTEEVKEAQGEEILDLTDEFAINYITDIVRKSGHIYIGALNGKSALKRFKKGKGHASIPKSNFDLNNPFKQ